MSSSIPRPKISPPQLSTLRRVSKPIFKSNVAPTPTSVAKKFENTQVKPTIPKPATKLSFLEKNMFPIAIGVLGVSYLILRKKKN
jgi:hypothetical protein